MLGKKVYDYIYVNEGQLYVMMPVISGNTIGLDNTCQAGVELKGYFYDKKGLNSVKEYQEVLTGNIGMLNQLEGRENQKKVWQQQLTDLTKYEGILENFSRKKPNWVEAFNREYPPVPNEIQQVVKEGKNLSSILLAPKGPDDLLRLTNYTFSLKRDLAYRGEEEVFAKALREGMKGVKITTKGIDDIFKDASIEDVSEEGDVEERIKTIMGKMQAWLGEDYNVQEEVYANKGVVDLGGDMQGLKGYIEMVSGPIEEIDNEDIFNNLNYLLGVDVNQLGREKDRGLFVEEYSSKDFDNMNMQSDSSERMSILTQFFLGTVNVDQVASGNTTSNFGEVLDSDESLRNSLIVNLKSLIESGKEDSVERGVLGWINENQEAFGLRKVMEEGDVERIIGDFKANYPTIKGSPHFDEFLIRTNVKGGKWVTYQNRMGIDLGYAVTKGFEGDGLCDDKDWLDQKVSDYEGVVQNEGHELTPSQQTSPMTEEDINIMVNKWSKNEWLDCIDPLLKGGLLTEELTKALLDKVNGLDNKEELMMKIMNQCILNKLEFPLKLIAEKNSELINTRMKKAMADGDEGVALILLGLPAIDKSKVLFVEAINSDMEKIALKLLEQKGVRENAHADNNQALSSACEMNMKELAMELLKQPEVRNNAHAENNHALLVCNIGLESVALELLKLEGVQDHAHEGQNNALMIACHKGMSDVAQKLLELDLVKETPHGEKNFALKWACKNGMTKVALKLLELDGVIENAHAKDNEALRWTCQNKMTEVALKLLELDGVIENAHAKDNEALRWTCQNNMTEVALKLLDQPKVRDNAHSGFNYALRWACDKGMSEVALKLLEQSKVRENAQIVDNSALTYACMNGMSDVALELLKLDQVKENAHATDNYALKAACMNNMSDVVLTLLAQDKVKENAHEFDNLALRLACSGGMTDVALELLKLDKVRENDHANNNEALRWACRNSRQEVALKLLEQPEVRANAHAEDNYALRWACMEGMSEVALELLKLDQVQEHAHDKDNQALKLACEKGMPDVALKLLELDQVKNNVNDDDNKALRWACEKGMSDVAMELLKQPQVGKNADDKDNQALRGACKIRLPKVALELLKLDQVKKQAHVENNFALRLACRNGMSEVALKLLDENEVQKNAHVENNAALKLACLWGLETVALKLLDQSEVKKNAHLENNVALKNICFLGLDSVAMKLLDQKEVRDNLDPKNDKMKEYLQKWEGQSTVGSNQGRVISKLNIPQGGQGANVDLPSIKTSDHKKGG
ncbi:MAG TPA: hypothetical protein QF353_02510 [Gammaproteobacteria bacterium]|nr:hypothetical protein [Gammaproteobacteria bacterium]